MRFRFPAMIGLAALLLSGPACGVTRTPAPSADDIFGAEVVAHRWAPDTTRWLKLRRAQFLWFATVRNATAQSRKICVTYELLSAADQVLASSSKCEVVPPGTEGDVAGNAYVPSQVIAQAKQSRAIVTESHRLYFPAQSAAR